ncbi:MAG: NAD-dependent epimerase/dehydratase family protein [Prevotella sp.]|nr:NAD-dependent epimerase/dehydratase family protein [Prevotella sp.]
MTNQTVLITGVAGFIGAAVAAALLTQYPHCQVIGIDNLNPYYDVKLKKARLAQIRRFSHFTFVKGDITHQKTVERLFTRYRPTFVVHLAAQAGVTYSMTNPDAYIQSNIVGFYHILEACRHDRPIHLVYASSSSVYGEQTAIPYRTDAKVDQPSSLYAATKASNELLAAAYAHLYQIPATGLRFFTVYGPMGRPDMAYFKFTDRLLRGEKIELYNHGKNQRDFTYIDDIVTALLRVLVLPPVGHRRLNIGKGHPETVLTLVTELQTALQQVGLLPSDYDITAHQTLLPPQPADVTTTYADTSDLVALIHAAPQVTLRDGLQKFAAWYRDFYRK